MVGVGMAFYFYERGGGGSLDHFPPFFFLPSGTFFPHSCFSSFFECVWCGLFCFMPGSDCNHLEFHHSITQQSQWNMSIDGHVHVIINRTPGMKIDEKK
jgi:hypothetical protein